MEPLATADELRAYAQADVDEETATLAVENASGLVRDHCGWCISAEDDVTFVVDGTGTALLNLPTLLLRAVKAVRVGGAVLDAGSYTWATRGQLMRAAFWPYGFRNVEVDCSHGYQTTPSGVRGVVLELAAADVANPERLRMRITGSVSRMFGLPETPLLRLSGYVLP